MTETEIKKTIEDWLDAMGFVWSRNNPVRMTSRGFVPVRESQRGIPDIFVFPIFGDFKFLAVEVKAAGGRTSKAQVFWRAQVIAVGGKHIFAYSLDDVKIALTPKRKD